MHTSNVHTSHVACITCVHQMHTSRVPAFVYFKFWRIKNTSYQRFDWKKQLCSLIKNIVLKCSLLKKNYFHFVKYHSRKLYNINHKRQGDL